VLYKDSSNLASQASKLEAFGYLLNSNLARKIMQTWSASLLFQLL